MYKNKINARISWMVDFSFHRNSLLDFDYDSWDGIIYGFEFHLLKWKIGIWIKGDQMPF